MGKIRVNELASELKVKSKSILECLTKVGVTGKRSHSSAVEDEIATKVRAYFRSEIPPSDDVIRGSIKSLTAPPHKQKSVGGQQELHGRDQLHKETPAATPGSLKPQRSENPQRLQSQRVLDKANSFDEEMDVQIGRAHV